MPASYYSLSRRHISAEWLISMPYKRIVINCFLVICFLIFCTACQKSPDDVIVKSKHNQVYEGELVIDSTKSEAREPTNDVIKFNRIFSSSDGSVNFEMHIDQRVSASPLPIVQVTPHYLTGEDAKTVATTLFPNTIFYEAEPQLAEIYSKSEIREKLNRWSQYTNIASLTELYGDSESANTLQDILNLVKIYIEDYTQKYEQAPDENPHSLCAWSVRKESEYQLPEGERVGVDLSADSDAVCAQFDANGIPYRFTMTTRNKNDYKLNVLTCYIDDGLSPRSVDERIFSAELCRTQEPTEAQLNLARDKVENWLSEFNLGDWYVDECFVEVRTFGGNSEYMVHVNAVPKLNNVPVLRQPQLSALRNKDGYAPSQYLTEAEFVLSANCDLISFTLFTPLESQNVVSDNADILPINELLSQAQSHLTLSDSYNYGFGEYLFLISEELQCNVLVSELECGLSRIKVPDSEGSYYYVPSIILWGSSEYVGKESSKTYYVSDSPELLLIINAVDGTLINSTNT